MGSMDVRLLDRQGRINRKSMHDEPLFQDENVSHGGLRAHGMCPPSVRAVPVGTHCCALPR